MNELQPIGNPSTQSLREAALLSHNIKDIIWQFLLATTPAKHEPVYINAVQSCTLC